MGRRLTPNEKYLLIISLLILIASIFVLGCTGKRGDTGAAAPIPSIYTLPASLSDCVYGGVDVWVQGEETIVCNGQPGAAGAIGATGSTGNTGATGQDGAPGTVVEMIKFCPGTSSYGNFMEFGIRINNNVYAVYSANNGFLTILSPGAYRTTATGLNCNFTVNADGSVSY